MRRIWSSLTRPPGSGPIRTVRAGCFCWCGLVGLWGVSMIFAEKRGVCEKERHCGRAAACLRSRERIGDLVVASVAACEVHTRRAMAHEGRRRDIG